MRINKVINNNMVSILGADGREVLCRGLGIGFSKRPGDELEESRVESRFVLEEASFSSRLSSISQEADPALVEACFSIVDTIKAASPRPLSDSLYVMLTDHICNLVARLQQGIRFDNSVLWNLRDIYPDEYQLAQGAVRTLQGHVSDQIEDSEASFVTLHIVNAEMPGDMHDTYRFTTFMEDIRDIVSSNLEIAFDDKSYHVNRFLVHLRYLFGRLGTRPAPCQDLDLDGILAEALGRSCPQIIATLEKIVLYVEQSCAYTLSREEQLYLLIHLVQIFQAEQPASSGTTA